MTNTGQDECRCMTPPFDYRDYASREVGVDETHGRFGEVAIETCRVCGRTWLRYLVEYEAFTGSGRWFRGLVPGDVARKVTPEAAIGVLESLEWYFAGGSYFRSRGFRASGPVAADR